MRPIGWRYESHRHALAARGIKTNYYASKARRYNYTPTYVASDLPLIAGDALGTAGAEVVSLIPVAVPALMVAGGAVLAKKAYDKTKGKKKYAVQKETDPRERDELRRKLNIELDKARRARFVMGDYMRDKEGTSGLEDADYERAMRAEEEALERAKKISDRLEPPVEGSPVEGEDLRLIPSRRPITRYDEKGRVRKVSYPGGGVDYYDETGDITYSNSEYDPEEPQ